MMATMTTEAMIWTMAVEATNLTADNETIELVKKSNTEIFKENAYEVVVTFLIGFFGVTVNILALIVFHRPAALEKVGDSLRINMIWLSVCDIFTLWSKINALENKFFQYTDIWFLCKQKWVESTFCGWSHFVTLNLTIERFIAIYFPHRYKSLCNYRSASLANAFYFFVIGGYTALRHFLFRGVDRPNNKCFVHEEFTWFVKHIDSPIGSGYVYIFPIHLQLLVNLAVMYKFVFGDLPQMQEKAKKRMFKTVALVSLFSWGLNFPHMVTRMDSFVNGWKFTSARGWREMNWLMLMNHGMHMPIYCISGPWFRQELKRLFTMKSWKTASWSTASEVSSSTSGFTASSSSGNSVREKTSDVFGPT